MIAGLPYDAEVEYLESTGTQWIDTGVKFSGADDIDISFSATDSSYYAAIFGAGNADGDAGASYSVYLQNRAQVVFQCTAARGAAFNYSSGTRYNVSCAVSNGAMSVDGSPCGTNGTPLVSCDYNVYLFARNVAGSVDRRGKFRVYSFSIAGKVDFIPVRFTNELGVSEGAMYDRVSRKLFRNAGTGAFTIGPDVATPVMGLHFMKSPAKTARDYVQDGLIAMWDGIENAGWGVHDPNATTWKDMVGSNDLTIYGNVLSNCISNIGLSQSAAGASFKIDGISTIEACHEYQGGSITYGIIANTGGVDTSRIGLVHYGAANAFQTYSNIFWAYPEIENQHAITLCGTTAGCYVNGNELQPVTHSADPWNNGSVTIIGGRMNGSYRLLAKYFCVRFYSRDLTAAEIAHNFAVDKERFNLP